MNQHTIRGFSMEQFELWRPMYNLFGTLQSHFFSSEQLNKTLNKTLYFRTFSEHFCDVITLPLHGSCRHCKSPEAFLGSLPMRYQRSLLTRYLRSLLMCFLRSLLTRFLRSLLMCFLRSLLMRFLRSLLMRRFNAFVATYMEHKANGVCSREMKVHLNFHQVAWRRRLTNGSDVKLNKTLWQRLTSAVSRGGICSGPEVTNPAGTVLTRHRWLRIRRTRKASPVAMATFEESFLATCDRKQGTMSLGWANLYPPLPSPPLPSPPLPSARVSHTLLPRIVALCDVNSLFLRILLVFPEQVPPESSSAPVEVSAKVIFSLDYKISKMKNQKRKMDMYLEHVSGNSFRLLY